MSANDPTPEALVRWCEDNLSTTRMRAETGSKNIQRRFAPEVAMWEAALACVLAAQPASAPGVTPEAQGQAALVRELIADLYRMCPTGGPHKTCPMVWKHDTAEWCSACKAADFLDALAAPPSEAQGQAALVREPSDWTQRGMPTIAEIDAALELKTWLEAKMACRALLTRARVALARVSAAPEAHAPTQAEVEAHLAGCWDEGWEWRDRWGDDHDDVTERTRAKNVAESMQILYATQPQEPQPSRFRHTCDWLKDSSHRPMPCLACEAEKGPK